ncbi:MAG TPA: UDP-glucose 4-epimerase GalE [Candidatus Woesearchaeota archaeon]|nr:UDP-glucose 4-epimerase GalE [Candidatus Woesearchaeota archaeon]
MRNVLVTGGLGYIGSMTAKLLKKKGYNVFVVDNLSNGSNELKLEGASYFANNIGDYEAMSLILKENRIDAVIHFAANIEVGLSMENPADFFENNICEGISLLKAMKDSNVKRIIFSSSAAVYGIPEEDSVKEDMSLSPINAYGETKAMFERILNWFDIAYKMKFVALRYFNAAGADPELELGDMHKKRTHLIPSVIDTALGRRDCFYVFGNDYPTLDGTGVRDYVHVYDLAKAHMLALDFLEEEKKSDVFNVGYGKGSSVMEVIKMVKEVSGKDFPVEFKPRRPGDPAKLIANPEKIKRLLGWEPEYSDIKTIVKHAYDWEVKQNKSRS